MEKYLSLTSAFTLKHSISLTTLYCLTNGAAYELEADQADFIQLLDGTCTEEQLIQLYEEGSSTAISQFLAELKEMKAVEELQKSRQRILRSDRVPDRRLESVHLEASGICNMRCVHCYQAEYVRSKSELSYAEVMKLLDQMYELQVNNVSVSGGEPLMMPGLIDILKAIEERDMSVSALFSNGLLIDEQFIESVLQLRRRLPLFISLDSIPGGNVSFRGVNQKRTTRILDRIIRNVRLLVASGVDVILNTVVNSENIDQLNEMYALVIDLGVDSWRLGFPKETYELESRGRSFQIAWDKIAPRYLSILRRHLENSMPFRLQIEYVFREELLKQDFRGLTSADFVCDYEGRRSDCCVKPNGDVVSCAYCSDLPIGNIRQSPLRDIWYSAQMNHFKMMRVGDVADCQGCRLIGLCGTGCRANAYFLHGDFNHAKDDHACSAVAFFNDEVVPLLKEYDLVR